jgi:2-amino-4-hydroxy-6-hydroxymethyldihydropteridine diphosphokinase
MGPPEAAAGPPQSLGPKGVNAWVGLGANLGDAAATLRKALQALGRLPQTRVLAASSLWRSRAQDGPGPDYVNAVAALHTALSAAALLEALHAIESAHGRQRSYRNAPRTLDLDLLLYAGHTLHSPALHLPHARMHQRAFVLKPLLELWPQAWIPGHASAAACLAALPDQGVERMESRE